MFKYICPLLFLFTSLNLFSLEPSWRYSAGGRISSIQAEGPDGSLYLVSENRALHSIDPHTGVQNWFLRPGGKLQPYIAVGPDCTIYILNNKSQLFAVNQGGYIRWKKQLRSNVLCSPAVNQRGELILILDNGTLLSYDRRGKEIWSEKLNIDVSLPPVLNSHGGIFLADTQGVITILNSQGRISNTVSLQDTPSVLIWDQESSCLLVGTMFGLVYAMSETGDILWEWQEEQGERIAFILQNKRTLYISYSSGNIYKVYNREKTVHLIKLPNPGGSAALDLKGRILYPTANGRILIVEDGKTLDIENEAILTAPLLSQSGTLVTGGDDWVLYGYLWSPPAAGWTQYLSSSRRNSQSFSAPFQIMRDDALFSSYPEYIYYKKLIQSGSIENAMKVLDELKEQILEKDKDKRVPYTDLLLYKLIASGQTAAWGRKPGDGGKYDTSLIRSEAYMLIAHLDDYRYRSLLLPLLNNEQDTVALSKGFLALGVIGVDYDGRSVRLIADKITQLNILDDRLAITAINAIKDIYDYNGYMTDDSGYFILDYILKAPLSGTTKKYVMDVYKSLL